MLTARDFEHLCELEVESGYHLCQEVPYCFGNSEIDKLIGENDIEELAKKLIESYVSLLYGPLNRYLRKEPPRIVHSLLESFGSMLNESLKYIPSFDNGIVYRNEMATDHEQLRQWFSSHVGEVVKFPGFLSTYHNREYWKHAEPNFMIETKSNSKGRHISSHVDKSIRLKESEVLFQKDACFRVISANDIIHLQEVEEEPSQTLWEHYFYDHNTAEGQEPLSLSDLGEI